MVRSGRQVIVVEEELVVVDDVGHVGLAFASRPWFILYT